MKKVLIQKWVECIVALLLIGTLAFSLFSCIEKSEISPLDCDVNQEEGEWYILNIHSKKIHKTTCGTATLIHEKNRRTYQGDMENLLEIGYTTCGNCF